jgi:hypothetical protein
MAAMLYMTITAYLLLYRKAFSMLPTAALNYEQAQPHKCAGYHINTFIIPGKDKVTSFYVRGYARLWRKMRIKGIHLYPLEEMGKTPISSMSIRG